MKRAIRAIGEGLTIDLDDYCNSVKKSFNKSSQVKGKAWVFLKNKRILVFALVLVVFQLFCGANYCLRAQAIVGQVVGTSPSGTQGTSVSYSGGNVLTNNGLITYEAFGVGRNGNLFLPAGYINLNELTVNIVQSPIPTGKLSLSKVIGKNGDHVVISWKIE